MGDLITIFKEMNILDVLDIALVSLVIYYSYKFIRSRKIDKLALGVILLIIIQVICINLELKAMQFILTNIFQVGIIAIIVIFQPEFRGALEKMGAEPIKNIRSMTRDTSNNSAMIEQICSAVADMSANKIGSLIVIERDMKTDDIYSGGTVLDSAVSRNLINTVFFKMTALHDGAMIIRNKRIHAAACCLPLSTSESDQEAAHTRHLAALGTSERSDALVVVTSEESGKISLAIGGKFERFANAQALRARLSELLDKEDRSKGEKRRSQSTKGSDKGE